MATRLLDLDVLAHLNHFYLFCDFLASTLDCYVTTALTEHYPTETALCDGGSCFKVSVGIL